MISLSQYKAYSNLTLSLLGTNFLYLNEQLEGCDYLDRTNIPAAISKSFDLVLLGDLLNHSNVGQFCEVKTLFNIHFSTLHLWNNDGFAIIGPYLLIPLKSSDIETILKTNKVSPTLKEKYINYYNSLPILNYDKIKVIFDTLSQSIYNEQIEYSEVCNIELPTNIVYPSLVFEAHSLQKRADAIEQRYLIEQEFLSKVAKGEYELAYNLVKSPLFLDRIPNKLRNEKNLLIVLNTLLRKTIESAKIHPFYIDHISAKWAVRIEQISVLKDIDSSRRDMIYDYCHLVRTNPLTNYSSNVRKMITYVQLNISMPIALEDISKKLNVNASYLSQQFNKEVGKSLPEYVTEKRIQEAKYLLRGHSTLSISKIATAVGFSEVNYFARVFKTKTGITPREYRNQRMTENIV